jgi:hypothetical protein
MFSSDIGVECLHGKYGNMKFAQPRIENMGTDEFHLLMGAMRSNNEDHIIIDKKAKTTWQKIEKR